MHTGLNTRPRRMFGWPSGGLLAGLLLLWFGCFMAGPIEHAGATTYTYVDDKGTVVFTDKLDSIPARYRARVKVVEDGDRSRTDSSAATVKQATERATEMVSRFTITVPGLSPHQSTVLSLACVAAVLMAGTMLLSGNPAVRLLMRWLLVLLAIGTTATMFFSEESLLQKTKGAAKGLERTQQQKAQEIQKMEPTEKEP